MAEEIAKKYEFTDEVRCFNQTRFRRIRAVRNFGNVKAGDLGGWIEKESNLSHIGNCWVTGNATVCGNAVVCGDVVLEDEAVVGGDSRGC